MDSHETRCNPTDLTIGCHYILTIDTGDIEVVYKDKIIQEHDVSYLFYDSINKGEYLLTKRNGLSSLRSIPIKATDGIKYDGGKARFELVPMEALMEEMKVLTLGAKKYTPDNWIYVKGRVFRYVGAAGRHLMQWWAGYMAWWLTKDTKYRERGDSPEALSMVDFETGISHMAHLACCAHFLTHCHLHPGDDEMEGYADNPKKDTKNPV